MKLPKDVLKRVIEKYGQVIDLKEQPEVLGDLLEDVAATMQVGGSSITRPASPFGVSWMDAWVAHWIYNDNIRGAEARGDELAAILKGLVDLKFNERLGEIRRYIRDYPGFREEPPDGGPPEPGPPAPAGPSSIATPDGGTPEPGTPPAGPSRFGGRNRLAAEPTGPEPSPEPPDGGTPEPGTPPDPPPGPESGFLHENPWILYWFVSIKAPMLLDVVDLHVTRRIEELRGRTQAR